MALPKTFDAAEAEPRLYARWEAADAFAAGANASRDETFCIMIPPPNVTGSLHMGHAFNNTLQDILTRWHRMRGFDTLWQPGQDHAGIATQMVVERQLAEEGLARTDFSREAFVGKVWEWKRQSGGQIIEQLKRLGASCDWSRNAFTMSGAPGAPEGEEGNFHDAVIRVFVDLYHKGHIYRGKRLVNWDPHFETAISDLEVEQVEVDGHLWRLRYPLEGGARYHHPIARDDEGRPTDWEERDYLVVATTRPETMLGDTGVAVHPEDPRYAHLIGRKVRLPLVGRSIPVVADPHADPEKGTGAVKITPAHDFDDWAVASRTGLPAINVMDTRAAMALRDNPDFAAGCEAGMLAAAIERLHGLDRYEARDVIVTCARDEGWLDGIDADRHMVPHGDRSKTAIEPYLTDQWFVDSARIVQPAIDAARTGLARGPGETDSRGKPAGTVILPEQDAKVYFNWLENIEPWCISRQLWWGHRIPVWYGPTVEGLYSANLADVMDEKFFCGPNESDIIRQAKDYYGQDVEIVFSDHDAMRGMRGHGKSEDSLTWVYLSRDPDVLDTWFSSGIWPLGTLGWPEDTEALRRYFPTDVLITGFDIIFFWVARMMMMQHAIVGERPFHTVYVHALVRDEKGRKMSKSLGNVLDPIELIDAYGADAVRFTLAAMAAMGRDLKLSPDRVAGYRNFTTKLWNAARFAEMNACRPDPAFDPAAVTRTANRWIVGETARIREATDAALASYRFNDAAGGLYAFTWGKVCDWYVEFAKPLLESGDAETVAETRATMAWVIDHCLMLLHPFMPFVTEELWGRIADRDKLLVHADWPEGLGAELIEPAADREMNWVIALIEAIRSARAEMHVPAGLHIPVLQLELDAAGRDALARNAALIRRLARIESISPAETAPKGAVTVPVEGGTLCLPLAEIIDVAREKARLEKTLAKLDKEMTGLRGRLDNPRFRDSAPAEVVEETRERLAQHEAEAARLRAALDRLAEVA